MDGLLWARGQLVSSEWAEADRLRLWLSGRKALNAEGAEGKRRGRGGGVGGMGSCGHGASWSASQRPVGGGRRVAVP